MIEAEALELVDAPPESLRSEFGFGRANGIRICVKRFEELLRIEIEKFIAEEEKGEDDF